MYQFEVHFYVQGVSGQIVMVVSAFNRQSAEDAIRAMYPGKSVQIHAVNRI